MFEMSNLGQDMLDSITSR